MTVVEICSRSESSLYKNTMGILFVKKRGQLLVESRKLCQRDDEWYPDKTQLKVTFRPLKLILRRKDLVYWMGGGFVLYNKY